MRRWLAVLLLAMVGFLRAQTSAPCLCGNNPPGPPPTRSMKPYTGAPDDLRPYSKFTVPYYEHYQDLVEYNGGARDVPDPDLSTLDEVRIGFIGPLYQHPDQVFGNRMLHGATMAIDEANARGGYCGKPFKLVLHNDSAIWGAASNEIVKMVYDDKVWAMFGSISGDTTHIALRVTLKTETPIVNSASTDPTIPETIIPWYFTDLQDDREQGYTLARHIYSELGLKRIAILRVNDRYGRFGVLKFRDASRRLGHPVVIEQKFLPGTTDFTRQLRVIQDSRVDGIVLWTDVAPTAAILQQMQQLRMKQRVFGSHRTLGDDLLKIGSAAEGFEAVFPYNPTSTDPRWLKFNSRYETAYQEKPDQFAALAYDAMQALLNAICRAGLNKGRIRDALTGITSYKGVTGDMIFDPNCKNIAPLFLARIHDGSIEYRRITMEKPYARVGEDGVRYNGPMLADHTESSKIAVFGPHADQVIQSSEIVSLLAQHQISIVSIPSQLSWGKASDELVKAVYDQKVVAVVALDRSSAHLAEQIAVKAFLPVIAISSDRSLTSTNIPWIFRLPDTTPVQEALRCLIEAVERGSPNRQKVRELLASGTELAGIRFENTGEPRF